MDIAPPAKLAEFLFKVQFFTVALLPTIHEDPPLEAVLLTEVTPSNKLLLPLTYTAPPSSSAWQFERVTFSKVQLSPATSKPPPRTEALLLSK